MLSMKWMHTWINETISTSSIGGVSSKQAALINKVLGEAFETYLHQQLQSGEFNSVMLGKILEWLKANKIFFTENADDRLKHLASAFRSGSDSDGFLSFLDGVSNNQP